MLRQAFSEPLNPHNYLVRPPLQTRWQRRSEPLSPDREPGTELVDLPLDTAPQPTSPLANLLTPHCELPRQRLRLGNNPPAEPGGKFYELPPDLTPQPTSRSEERRVGKEGSSGRWAPD